MQNLIESIDYHVMDTVNINDLADIQDVVIDTSLPVEERARSYFEQIKDPLLYKCDDTVIRISYADTDVSLADRLIQHLLSGSLIPAF